MSRKPQILLGVTGGIAAYKSPELVRRLRERGAAVRVVLTSSAARLVSPTVFQAVSGEPVRTDLWDEQAEAAMGHIELARWADRVVIAPATANVIAELATGTAGSLLTTLCLATRAPLLLAPAMNHAMWTHPATQANVDTLRTRGVSFIGPGDGSQACGETGPGRMAEPGEILAELLAPAAVENGVLQGLDVLITAGPTREPIDPVRFVSNRSSGKMGFALAAAAAVAGARVTLIAGPVALDTPAGVQRVDVETAAEMHEATLQRATSADIYIGAAAISDYRPQTVQTQKIKKHDSRMELQMVRSDDLLATIAALPDGPFTVGFAAETDRLEEHAQGKLQNKKLDMIVANLVGSGLGFDRDDNSAVVLWHGGRQELACKPKTELAAELVELISEHYRAQRATAPTPLRRPGVS